MTEDELAAALSDKTLTALFEEARDLIERVTQSMTAAGEQARKWGEGTRQSKYWLDVYHAFEAAGDRGDLVRAQLKRAQFVAQQARGSAHEAQWRTVQ